MNPHMDDEAEGDGIDAAGRRRDGWAMGTDVAAEMHGGCTTADKPDPVGNELQRYLALLLRSSCEEGTRERDLLSLR